MLTIVGLGPGSREYLSQTAYEVLLRAEKLYVRTSWHPVLDELDLAYESFDDAYEAAEDFDSLYRDIAQTVYEASRSADVVYAVPGSPYQAELTVRHLLALTDARVIGGVSFIEPVLQALQVDVTDGLQIIDGLSDFRLPSDFAGLILQVYSQAVASDVKLKLMETIEDERVVSIIKWAGVPGKEQRFDVPLYQLDHEAVFDHLTTVYVPAGEASHRSLERLVAVTARLRGPGGCAWDSEQTHASLKRYLIEEAYEVLEAIDSEDYEQLADELGDLLFQAVFHAQIASEAGYFTMEDVIEGITDKLIRRHSHVFQDDTAQTPEEVVELWEKNKQAEKTIEQRLASIPRVSPLHYAQKTMKLLKIVPQNDYSGLNDQDLVERLQDLIAEATRRDVSLDLALKEAMDQLKPPFPDERG